MQATKTLPQSDYLLPFSSRLPASLLDSVREVAAQRGTTVQQVHIDALQQFLEKENARGQRKVQTK